ncbi:MAG: PQQ-binding-like beta-propeller repeat protein [Planctomycetota bacterium]
MPKAGKPIKPLFDHDPQGQSSPWFFAVILTLLVVVISSAAHAQNAPSNLPIFVNDSREAQELAAETDRLIGENRHDAAAATLQRVLDRHANTLMAVTEDRYVATSLWARQALLDDRTLLDAYRRRFQAVAEHAFGQARTARDDAEVLRLIHRYPLTRQSLDAGLWLIGRDLEAARARPALSLIQRFDNHPDRDVVAATLDYLAGVAATLADDPILADTFAERLRLAAADTELNRLDALRASLRPLPDHTPADHQPASSDPLPDFGPEPPPLTEPLWVRDLAETDINIGVKPDATEPDIQIPLPGQDRLVPDPRARDVFPGQMPNIRIQAAQQNNGNPRPITVHPALANRQLLINDGLNVQAIDPFSGRLLWRFDFLPFFDLPNWEGAELNNRRIRNFQPMPDVRGVAIQHRSVFAVLGYAFLYQQDDNARRQTNLVALDQDTGKLRWRVSPITADPSLEGGFFFGTPLAGRDHVYVMARKTQRRGFHDTYALALDARTGQLAWRVHLSSVAPYGSRVNQRAPTLMSLDRGTLYLTDAIGTAAAIDARSGTARWVRILADDGLTGRDRLRVRREAAAGPPVRLPAGLVVPIITGRQPAYVVDPATGEDRSDQFQLTTTPWATFTQARAADGDLLLIGRQVTRLNGHTLEPIWSRQTNLNAVGQAALSRNHLVIAGNRELAVLDLNNAGRIIRQHDALTGSLAAGPNALFLVNQENAAGYMTWDHAYTRLRQQIDQVPEDPQPALGLAYLGFRNARAEGLLEGLDLAIESVELAETPSAAAASTPDTRERVIAQMLLYAADARTGAVPNADPRHAIDTRQSIYDRIALLTQTASQEVRYHLSIARFYIETERPSDAVGHYQAVLMDDLLANEPYTDSSIARRAGLEARQQLRGLHERFGPAVYEAFDAQAAVLFEEMQLDGTDSPEALIRLAETFPVATVTPRVLALAAERLDQRGDLSRAITFYRRAFRQARDRNTQAVIAGQLAHCYTTNERPAAAIRWLQRIETLHPGLLPLDPADQNTPTDPLAWADRLRSLPNAHRLVPTYSAKLEQPFVLPGRIVPAAPDAYALTPDRLLIQNGNRLELYHTPLTSPTPKPAWSIALPQGPEPIQALAIDTDRSVLHLQNSQRIVCLSNFDGGVLWEIRSLPDLFAPLAPKLEPARTTAENRDDNVVIRGRIRVEVNGQVVQDRDLNNNDLRSSELRAALQPVGPPFRLLATESILCIVNQTGQLAAIDLHSGDTLWTRASRIANTLHATANDNLVALAGAAPGPGNSTAYWVSAFDLYTGEQAFNPLSSRHRPQWLGLSPASQLLFTAKDSAYAFSTASGRRLWIQPQLGLTLAGQGWVGVDYIALADDEQGITLLDPADGSIRRRVSVRSNSRRQAPNFLPTPGGFFTWSSRGVKHLLPTGQTKWSDGLALYQDQIAWAAPARDTVVAVLQKIDPSRGMIPSEPLVPHRIAVFHRDSGMLLAQSQLPTVSRPGQLLTPDAPGGQRFLPPEARLLTDALAVSLEQHTLLIPAQPATSP